MDIPVCTSDFVMTFGKYKGQSLEQIAEHDGQYILWLNNESVLRIDREFLDAVEMDERENDNELYDGCIPWD